MPNLNKMIIEPKEIYVVSETCGNYHFWPVIGWLDGDPVIIDTPNNRIGLNTLTDYCKYHSDGQDIIGLHYGRPKYSSSNTFSDTLDYLKNIRGGVNAV